MTKRGPKPFHSNCGRPMPFRLIAQRIGVSVRTVKYDFARGMTKLRSLSLGPEVR